MSKQFLQKPRYEYYKGTTEVVDNELDNFVEDVVLTLNVKDSNIKELVRIKNNQYEQIADLQHRLEVAEKALELACEELMGDLEFNGELDKHYNLQANIEYFKTKAREVLKSE